MSLNGKTIFKQINPKPPPTLNKETIGVWSGWGNLGNKEVAREAAAKGSHVELAILFLSARKDITFEDAKIWFTSEVIKWVSELLERRQIFKASHVLNNIGVDAALELSKIFYTTKDNNLREYIGQHLIKIDKLSENLKDLWSFLLLMQENNLLISKYKLNTESIECLDKQSSNIKSEIATILFLKTDDIKLINFLNAETLWKYLLINKDVNNLLTWINLKYDSNFDNNAKGSVNIIDLFRKFPINNDMLHLVSNPEINIPFEVKEAIYNEFSKFGIFTVEEKNNIIVILQRLKNSFSIASLYEILTNNSSVLSLDNFIKLLCNYCLDKQLFSILNVCVKDFDISDSSPYLSLINHFRLLVNDFSEDLLRDNILKVCNILSNDIVSYLNDHPTVLLALIIFTKELNIVDIIAKNSSITINNVRLDDSIIHMLESFPVLKSLCQNKIKGPLVCNLTVYDLIDKHLNIPSTDLFQFRYKGNNLPHFTLNELVQNYGYSKQIDYKFYLKQARPSTAAKVFILKELETYDCIIDDDLRRTEKKVCKLCSANFDCDEITSGCIAFLEMIGLNSIKLRVLIKTAKILYEFGYEKVSVLELISNDEDPYFVQNLLETNLIQNIESNSLLTGSQLLEALRIFEIVVQFSKLNNIKLPEAFLKYCASRNLWLPFLIFAQIHNYPVDQIKLLIQFFKSPNMLEHLTHGVINDVHVEEKSILMKERDSRKAFLSKIGVRTSIEILNQTPTHSIMSQSSLESEDSTASSDIFEIDISNIKATLLQTLIRCHNSTDPPKALLQACQLYRNPLLAIFATSYEPDSIITNWLTWLAVSCEICQVFTNFEATAISANSVTQLLENCLRNQYPRTVYESFEIFMPDHPLKNFLEFLNICHKLIFNNTLLTLKLEAFHSSLKSSRKNSMFNETDHEMTYLNNRIWIEMTALRLLSALLDCNCNSLHEQILITESLCNVKIWDYFSCECPNFSKFLNILKALYESNSGVALNIGILFDLKNNRQAVISCINELLELHYFEVALKIAQIENLPPDLILIKEWQYKINDRSDPNFWTRCNETFLQYNVTADCVVDFYLDCSEKVSDLLEKFSLAKLAWEWAANYELTCQYELEKKMWLAFLCLDEKHKDLNSFNIKPAVFLYKDLTEILETVTVFEGELNKEFSSQLERMVAFALNKGNFWLALRLQKMFRVKSADLEILKLCHSLAEGILLPYQLNAEQRLMLSNASYRTYRRPFLSTKLSSFSSSSHSPLGSLLMQTADSVDSSMSDTLAILNLLTEHLRNGVEIGLNIFMTYRISINIEIPYQVVVVTTDYMKILKDSIEDNCMNKLDVVHDFIYVFKWSKHEVADFVCEELVNATSSYVQKNMEYLIMWDLNIDQDFQSILQLLPDNCSILGHKIYSYANTLHKSQIESNASVQATDLSLIIELLIRAHDCFTADCNMEGISVILKKSKEVISNLLVLQDWKLIVRLLTGVGRYTEMNYVFQILKENDQFEFLLRKGLKKDNTLKVALLEYLKRFCPDNRDLYKIVALHFTLFSEVAILWEREAETLIKNLISISKLEMQNNKLNPDEEPFVLFQNTDGTKICLNKAMENYTHATDFHLQGEKLTKAMNSAKQAELIALQLGILNEVSANESTVCLLDLTQSQIASLISSKLSFEQCLIVVEAYDFHPDWASVLYEQYVVKNNEAFLESFLKYLSLTDTLVQDISRKFVASGINSVTEIKCMKNIVRSSPSLHMKYRIASELGFTDVVEDLLASGQLVYLKDTVWKKGYKS